MWRRRWIICDARSAAAFRESQIFILSKLFTRDSIKKSEQIHPLSLSRSHVTPKRDLICKSKRLGMSVSETFFFNICQILRRESYKQRIVDEKSGKIFEQWYHLRLWESGKYDARCECLFAHYIPSPANVFFVWSPSDAFFSRSEKKESESLSFRIFNFIQ